MTFCGYNPVSNMDEPYNIFTPFIAHDNSLDLEWIIINACSTFNYGWIPPLQKFDWGMDYLVNMFLPSSEFINPIHGIIGFRGDTFITDNNSLITMFEENLRTVNPDTNEYYSVKDAWIRASIDTCDHVDVDDVMYLTVATPLNAVIVVRENNLNDKLLSNASPYVTMTKDINSTTYKYFYIDYKAQWDDISEKYLILPISIDNKNAEGSILTSNGTHKMPPVYKSNVINTPFPIVWYEDADGDGYGNWNKPKLHIVQPVGYVAEGTDSDCNDNNPSIYPGAVEKCDSKDNDCDTYIDEDCVQ